MPTVNPVSPSVTSGGPPRRILVPEDPARIQDVVRIQEALDLLQHGEVVRDARIDLSRESTMGAIEEGPLVGQGQVEILDGPAVIRLVEPVVDRVRGPSQVDRRRLSCPHPGPARPPPLRPDHRPRRALSSREKRLKKAVWLGLASIQGRSSFSVMA